MNTVDLKPYIKVMAVPNTAVHTIRCVLDLIVSINPTVIVSPHSADVRDILRGNPLWGINRAGQHYTDLCRHRLHSNIINDLKRMGLFVDGSMIDLIIDSDGEIFTVDGAFADSVYRAMMA